MEQAIKCLKSICRLHDSWKATPSRNLGLVMTKVRIKLSALNYDPYDVREVDLPHVLSGFNVKLADYFDKLLAQAEKSNNHLFKKLFDQCEDYLKMTQEHDEREVPGPSRSIMQIEEEERVNRFKTPEDIMQYCEERYNRNINKYEEYIYIPFEKYKENQNKSKLLLFEELKLKYLGGK